MATSSLARDFRKINIEQYDEDFYVEDDVSAGASAPDHNQIQMAISGGKPLDALKAALSTNPAGSSDIQLKLNCTESALRAMGAHKLNQIESSIKSLSIEEQDLLMQYIYKGFESFNKDSQTCSNLLNWHSQLVKMAGDGAIVRVLTDRRRL